MNRALQLTGLALLGAFHAWLLVFSIGLGLTSAVPWWGIAAAGALAGLLVVATRPDAWPLGLAVALGGSAVMRAYFLVTAFSVTYRGLVALGLAVALVVAAVGAVRGRRVLRGALVAVVVFVALAAARDLWLAQWPALARQLLHLAAFLALVVGTGTAAPTVGGGDATTG